MTNKAVLVANLIDQRYCFDPVTFDPDTGMHLCVVRKRHDQQVAFLGTSFLSAADAIGHARFSAEAAVRNDLEFAAEELEIEANADPIACITIHYQIQMSRTLPRRHFRAVEILPMHGTILQMGEWTEDIEEAMEDLCTMSAYNPDVADNILN